LLRYSYSIASTALDFNAICNKPDAKYRNPDFVRPPMFLRNFETLSYGVDTGNDAICKRALKEMAFVQFQLATQTVTQIKRGRRVSFADSVSNFGKPKLQTNHHQSE